MPARPQMTASVPNTPDYMGASRPAVKRCSSIGGYPRRFPLLRSVARNLEVSHAAALETILS